MKGVKNGIKTLPRGRPFEKGNPGRKKGNRNKLTGLAKDNIGAVYEGLGSVDGHIEFLKKHPKALADFYLSVYPRLLPMDVQHGGEVKTGGRLVVEVVHVKGAEPPGDEGGNGQKGK